MICGMPINSMSASGAKTEMTATTTSSSTTITSSVGRMMANHQASL